eukprot:TRINITY_DN3881_c0_g1_i4.p1 TRINITY_DN3881_c0_g1~~TRINITY_DN3881_c0_g1_i4.p1  ORF type:complete len:224 (+),score=53.17 TRINITY_DN3881_c0_g1_i4:602-1273(+)
MAGSDSKDHRWENYCKTIKAKEPNSETEKPLAAKSIPRKSKKAKKTAFMETSGEAESFPHDDSHAHTTEIHGKSPVLASVEEAPNDRDNSKILPEISLLDDEKKDPSEIVERLSEQVLEERIKILPVAPASSAEYFHVHCDYCGHPTIIHNNHFDYLCEGELHFVSRTGAVYPHKLEASSTNPVTCQFQNIKDPIHTDNLLSMDEFQCASVDEIGLNEVLFPR